jgi:4-carboxymuconolactone decarboxylase
VARLPTPRREDLSPEQQKIYDSIVETRGGIMGPFTVLLHSPVVGGRVADVGTYIRFESILPIALRCLAAVVTSRELDCAFEWSGWVPQALKAGIRQETIDAIQDGRTPLGLTEDEALVVSVGRQLLRGNHHISNETFRAIVDRFGTQGAVELTSTFGYFAMLAMSLNAFEVDAHPGTPVLPY